MNPIILLSGIHSQMTVIRDYSQEK